MFMTVENFFSSDLLSDRHGHSRVDNQVLCLRNYHTVGPSSLGRSGKCCFNDTELGYCLLPYCLSF